MLKGFVIKATQLEADLLEELNKLCLESLNLTFFVPVIEYESICHFVLFKITITYCFRSQVKDRVEGILVDH